MPYRFELSDVSLTQGMRRLALAEIARIQDALSQDPADTAAIHTARKGIKKLRALLRLLRAGLADVQPAENAILRAAGHALAGQRDAAVRLATFDRVVAGADLPCLAPLRAHLLTEAAAARQPTPDLQAVFASLALRVEGWEVTGNDRRILMQGLAETRLRARRAMRTARDSREAEALHDWRKRAKDHWYQARLLQPIWPEVLRPLAAEADRLAVALGDHHDLAELRAHLAPLAPAVLPPEAADLLTARIQDAQTGIEAMAFPLGARLFAGEPEEIADLWVKWWKVWRAQLGGAA
ncbi:CHAD domain-containing protein [Gemmobacter lanyuensis]|uniref:CHAD domain-containing protein n=1 Tax=Gemmobacter lanyuensis TaxID=1054497 RepID=A0A918IRD9_9RHOB|nr:CHAD domain-containing protein [Gemmobacter lanyuensis]GGW27894.1 CHAD domain-containing protein [Gemmobacter lanyuensis]